MAILPVVLGGFFMMKQGANVSSANPAPSTETPNDTAVKETGDDQVVVAPVVTVPVVSEEKLGSITMVEVAKHSSKDSCYTVISGSVYDVTPWIGKHPGGEDAILSLCGKDGTAGFTDQHSGQRKPTNMLANFKVGELAK